MNAIFEGIMTESENTVSVNNAVMFKQLLQAEAIDAVQLDALRLSGMNEILKVCLMAAKFGVPIIPHSG